MGFCPLEKEVVINAAVPKGSCIFIFKENFNGLFERIQ